jgi:hypothetical protein
MTTVMPSYRRAFFCKGSLNGGNALTPSPFLIQLALLFLPGVIWTHLDARFGTRSEPTQVEFVFQSFLFGMASYVVVFAGYWLFGFSFTIIDLSKVESQNLLTSDIVIQIAIATVIGFLLGISWLYAVNYKWMTRFLQLIGATKTYGDEDVWDFMFNSSDATSEYVHVRDFENKIVYAGWVAVFSETGKMRELVLRDAIVYDFDGEQLFASPRVYMSRKPEGMNVEFPATKANTEELQ